jgi:hypothetical protein
MLKKIALIVAGLLVVLVLVIVTRPATFEVKRSAVINAPPSFAYALVNDFHGWAQWSPWEKLDPAMQRTFTGAERGSGAKYQWKGNKQAGEGSMTITEASPDAKVSIDLEFIEPFPTKNLTTFTFASAGQSTTVTWVMSGENNFISKAMSLVMNMDSMIGPDFEAGLAKLKQAAEAQFAQAAKQAVTEPSP